MKTTLLGPVALLLAGCSADSDRRISQAEARIKEMEAQITKAVALANAVAEEKGIDHQLAVVFDQRISRLENITDLTFKKIEVGERRFLLEIDILKNSANKPSP